MSRSRSRSRSRRSRSGGTSSVVSTVIITLCVLVIIAGGVFAAYTTGVFAKEDDQQSQEPVVVAKDISADISQKLTEGTALSFGAEHSVNTPMVAIVGDPEALSRSKHIVNGKPSDFLNAIKERKISFFYYPVSADKELSTDSLTRASICRLGAEKTKSGIFTLNGIVRTGDKLTGKENVQKVSSMMGVKKDAQCPRKTNEAASQTALNADFFYEHFGLGREGNGEVAVIAGGQHTTHPEKLNENWIDEIIAGNKLEDVLD